MAAALETSAATVHRGHQAGVAPGREAACVRQRPTGRQDRTRDGAQEAQLIAVACRTSPEDHARWTLQRLADTLVARDMVATVRTERVRTTRKKTRAAVACPIHYLFSKAKCTVIVSPSLRPLILGGGKWNLSSPALVPRLRIPVL